MGLFDKVKNFANKVTGAGATVTISIEGNKLNETIKVNVTAVVKDAPIEIKKVYLRVKSVEKINIPKNDLPNTSQNPLGVNIEKEVFQRVNFDIAEAQTLEGGKTYNWSYDVNLSGDSMMPTYFGKYVSHQWMFMAGLDAKGNDPDSKWQPQQLS